MAISFDDLFGGTAQDLTAHTPDTDDSGNGWVQAGGGSLSWDINGSGGVDVTGPATADHVIVFDGGDADGTYISNITIGTNTTTWFRFVFRYQDVDNYLYADLDSDGFTQAFAEMVSGTATGLKNSPGTTLQQGSTYEIKVVCDGDDIQLLIDDTPQLSYNTSRFNAATKYGYGFPPNFDSGYPTYLDARFIDSSPSSPTGTVSNAAISADGDRITFDLATMDGSGITEIEPGKSVTVDLVREGYTSGTTTLSTLNRTGIRTRFVSATGSSPATVTLDLEEHVYDDDTTVVVHVPASSFDDGMVANAATAGGGLSTTNSSTLDYMDVVVGQHTARSTEGFIPYERYTSAFKFRAMGVCAGGIAHARARIVDSGLNASSWKTMTLTSYTGMGSVGISDNYYLYECEFGPTTDNGGGAMNYGIAQIEVEFYPKWGDADSVFDSTVTTVSPFDDSLKVHLDPSDTDTTNGDLADIYVDPTYDISTSGITGTFQTTPKLIEDTDISFAASSGGNQVISRTGNGLDTFVTDEWVQVSRARETENIGTFRVVSSTAGTLTVAKPNGVVEAAGGDIRLLAENHEYALAENGGTTNALLRIISTNGSTIKYCYVKDPATGFTNDRYERLYRMTVTSLVGTPKAGWLVDDQTGDRVIGRVIKVSGNDIWYTIVFPNTGTKQIQNGDSLTFINPNDMTNTSVTATAGTPGSELGTGSVGNGDTITGAWSGATATTNAAESANGDETGAGSAGDPVRTIKKASQLLDTTGTSGHASGGRILLKPGDYGLGYLGAPDASTTYSFMITRDPTATTNRHDARVTHSGSNSGLEVEHFRLHDIAIVQAIDTPINNDPPGNGVDMFMLITDCFVSGGPAGAAMQNSVFGGPSQMDGGQSYKFFAGNDMTQINSGFQAVDGSVCDTDIGQIGEDAYNSSRCVINLRITSMEQIGINHGDVNSVEEGNDTTGALYYVIGTSGQSAGQADPFGDDGDGWVNCAWVNVRQVTGGSSQLDNCPFENCLILNCTMVNPFLIQDNAAPADFRFQGCIIKNSYLDSMTTVPVHRDTWFNNTHIRAGAGLSSTDAPWITEGATLANMFDSTATTDRFSQNYYRAKAGGVLDDGRIASGDVWFPYDMFGNAVPTDGSAFVGAAQTPPVLATAITAPTDGVRSFTTASFINFTSDAAARWSSDINGELAADSADFNASLSAGAHTISIEPVGGGSTIDSITLFVSTDTARDAAFRVTQDNALGFEKFPLSADYQVEVIVTSSTIQVTSTFTGSMDGDTLAIPFSTNPTFSDLKSQIQLQSGDEATIVLEGNASLTDASSELLPGTFYNTTLGTAVSLLKK